MTYVLTSKALASDRDNKSPYLCENWGLNFREFLEFAILCKV